MSPSSPNSKPSARSSTRPAPNIDTDQGLTKTYNALKDPNCTDKRILEHRELHEEMDRAVLRAYPTLPGVGRDDPNTKGWDDIKVPPFCIATEEDMTALQAFEDEIIDRLFVLNELRAREEAALGRGAKQKAAPAAAPKAAPKAAATPKPRAAKKAATILPATASVSPPVTAPAGWNRHTLTIFANAAKIAEIQSERHAMPTRNVNLTDALDQFVTSTVEAGRYENASEVVRAGLRALQEREQEYITFMRNEAAAGFAELDRGEGIRGTPDEIMDRINEELGITAR